MNRPTSAGSIEVAGIFRRNGYSPRARLLALFVICAMILGGGGTPNPATEVILELLFVAFALAWVWWTGEESEARSTSFDWPVLAVIAAILLVPVVQLLPLPPSIWTVLPGRENEQAALSLIGQQASWRPLSLSPSRTLASFLAMVPAVVCVYAVSRLELHERRLVLAAILIMAIVTSLLGVVQLTAGGAGINFYPQHHVGWVTGFQANRNAAADVLLIGTLALTALAAPYLVGSGWRPPFSLGRRALYFLSGGTALVLLAATVMTGSRTGTLLVLPVGAAALLMLLVGRAGSRKASPLEAVLLLGGIASAGAIFVLLSETTAVGRVAMRFTDLQSSRADVWQDALFALRQYWPVGFGMGGFEPAILPAERLEVLDSSMPNRAHNDFLEIGLEAGILGYAIVAVAGLLCLFLAWRAWRDVPAMRRQIIFGLGVMMIIGLHSIVDYPLRSMAVACLAGVAAGMLVKNGASINRPVSAGAPVEVKGLA